MISRWIQFIRERFEPRSHVVMILFFVAVHVAAASSLMGADVDYVRMTVAFVFSCLFFFKLRLYDEIKDFETDKEFNPTRPLARGLLTVKDVENAIGVVLIFEMAFLFPMGEAAALSGLFAIVYSLLMYREFYIGKWLRRRLTTYAVTHTVVCSMLSATLLSMLTDRLPIFWSAREWCFILASWFLFNVFEFGRKTFSTSEERERVPSYSKVFGRRGALILVLVQLTLSTLLYAHAFNSLSIRLALLLTWFLVLGVGLTYIKKNDDRSAKTYRNVTSLAIVLQQASLLLVFFL